MRYVSTRGAAPVLGFGEAMLTGLARDGGLYVPETVPALGRDEIAALSGLGYEETAFRVMRPFIGDAFTKLFVELADPLVEQLDLSGLGHLLIARLLNLYRCGIVDPGQQQLEEVLL